MSRLGIEPAALSFLAGHLDRLAIETVDYLCFKLLQYSEVTGNAWGVSKHVARQLINALKFKCNRNYITSTFVKEMQIFF